MERRSSRRPETEKIFQEEFRFLERSREICARDRCSSEELHTEYLILAGKFEKLLRATVKLTRIGDASQRKLLQAYEQIEKQKMELQETYELIRQANEDLTEAHRQLELASRLDPLTRIANRRDMMNRLVSIQEAFIRHPNPFVVAMGDIDDFKSFNDRYGHECGDYVLVSVARLMAHRLGDINSVARWGGEEFLILLPDHDLSTGQAVTEDLRRKVAARQYDFRDCRLNVTMTFGLTVYDRPKQINQCLQEADEALYQGKQTGKNRVIPYTPPGPAPTGANPSAGA